MSLTSASVCVIPYVMKRRYLVFSCCLCIQFCVSCSPSLPETHLKTTVILEGKV